MVFFLVFVRIDHWLKKEDQRTPFLKPKLYHLYEKMLRKMKLIYQEVLCSCKEGMFSKEAEQINGII